MLSDSEVRCPDFFLKFFRLCQLQIFIMFLRPGETDQHCLPGIRWFQQPVFTCSFRHHHHILQTFHVRQAHFACRQPKMFLIQIKNFSACRQANVACSVLVCQFCHADLATGETGKQK